MMTRWIRLITAAGVLWAVLLPPAAMAGDGAAHMGWAAACIDFVHDATTLPARWHGQRGATVRSLVRESTRGTPAVVSTVTMPAVSIAPAPFGAAPPRPDRRVEASTMVSLLSVMVAGMITMFLIFAALGVHGTLGEIAEGQRRLGRLQTTLLEGVAALVSAAPSLAPASAPSPRLLPGEHEPPPSGNHRLALTLSHEITKMQRRVAQLNPAGDAAKALDRALQRLRRELMAEGYTIHDPAGQRYTEGMQVSVAEFVPGAQPGDSDRIERTLKAEVRYGDTVIQPAVVVVKTHGGGEAEG
ncbi:MAG: hypothetical protein GF331_05280 [Chitinivibrionales bacterium]|nr:hypothetical protein [Chitinivibrionales bacterium]